MGVFQVTMALLLFAVLYLLVWVRLNRLRQRAKAGDDAASQGDADLPIFGRAINDLEVAAPSTESTEPLSLEPGVCPSCRTENDPFSRYCRHCAQRLAP